MSKDDEKQVMAEIIPFRPRQTAKPTVRVPKTLAGGPQAKLADRLPDGPALFPATVQRSEGALLDNIFPGGHHFRDPCELEDTCVFIADLLRAREGGVFIRAALAHRMSKYLEEDPTEPKELITYPVGFGTTLEVFMLPKSHCSASVYKTYVEGSPMPPVPTIVMLRSIAPLLETLTYCPYVEYSPKLPCMDVNETLNVFISVLAQIWHDPKFLQKFVPPSCYEARK